MIGKELFARRFRNSKDGGMLQFSFGRDRVEALNNGVDAADGYDPVLFPNLIFDRGWTRKDSHASLPERGHKRPVLEFADNSGLDIIRLEPLFQRTPQTRSVHR